MNQSANNRFGLNPYSDRQSCSPKINLVHVRAFLLRLALAVSIVFFFAMLSRAGGPKYIAGTSNFNTNLTGQPLTWPGGVIMYYTDQGDLSPILPNASANSFVANVFSLWSGIPTAALAISNGGQLAEDVNGSNVYVNSDGTITMPADIQPSATGTPIGVVYDYDGSVTNALIGSGAGDPSQCFFNAVYGGNDNFGALATYQHALIVINGQCALESSQLVDVEYRLQRIVGAVLGLGWSQANDNVLTGNPTPTSADFAGFPLMHYSDPISCIPITTCYPNPDQFTPDDVAAISRLYPVTAENQSSFSNSQVFSSTTARIYGTVSFTSTSGATTQPMQGVNVVARWINPANGVPSRQYVATSVSGFLFTGNAGNPITGFSDELGNPYNEWGSTTPSLEGFFDLGGLPLPNGYTTAQYQLTVEPIDPTWSVGVGPYEPLQVTPSGTAQPILVTVSAGSDIEQNIAMSGSTQPVPAAWTSETWTAAALVPQAGNWMGSLSGYGDLPYFALSAKANRTLSIAVIALDDFGNASELKAQPVIGMWSAADPEGTAPPALTPSSFNTPNLGLTLLNAQVATTGNFLIGISDVRGDGRPDYRYLASVLYADSVSPARVGVNGGPITVLGTGFSQGLIATVGNSAATQLSVNAGQMIFSAPSFPDGPENITIANPTNGASTVMTDALTYGAAASDTIVLLGGTNPSTPVGVQAANSVNVRVLASDGVTPVAGATIGWTATNNLQLSACNGASSCTVTSDQNGNASTWLTPTAVGVATITATLAPGVYNPASSVEATLNATESASDLGVLTPYLWIAQGATVTVPLTGRFLSNGVPQNNATLHFKLTSGSGTLSASSATTNSSGYATVNLALASFTNEVVADICVEPAGSPCQQIYANPVPASQLNLQPFSGSGQISTGQAFQPVVVRAVDSATPPHAVLAAPVLFLTMVERPQGDPPAGGNGETNPTNPAMPVILSVSQSAVASDINGLASLTPTSGNFSPPLEVDLSISTGTSAMLNDPLQVLPVPSGSGTEETNPPLQQPPIRHWEDLR